MIFKTIGLKKAIAGVVVLAAVGAGSVALVNAVSAAQSITGSTANPTYWSCLNKTTHQPVNGIHVYTGGSSTYPGCSTNYDKVWWSQQGNNKSADALVPATATAQTSITNWAETSGWATDNMIRTVNVTRQGAAESSKCGGAPTCYFYTATLTDNGTFTAINGKPAPNATVGGTITGNPTGSFIGGAKVEFYASSNAPNGSLVPATANSRASVPFGTSDWVKGFFPTSGVTFGASFNLTTYLWTYNAGCAAQTWRDGINPGNDGQSVADGNVTAVCPS